mgnify:CR=1 FL=1
MASTIQLKRGSGAPTGGDLAAGELGLDLTNNRVYSSTDGTDVVEMGTKPTSLAINTISEGTSGSGPMPCTVNKDEGYHMYLPYTDFRARKW